MKREYPRFLFSYPKDTKSKGPFVVHTLYPKALFRIDFLDGSYLPEIIEVWEPYFNNEKEAQEALIPLLIDVQEWAKANKIARFIRRDELNVPSSLKEMTRAQFLLALPESIEHPNWGYSELEIISDDEVKGACYRSREKFASGGNYGKSWGEVFIKMHKYLKSKKLI